MNKNEVCQKLFSENHHDIVEAVYKIDGSNFFKSPLIIEKIRNLVYHDDQEISEMALFRLLVRLKDITTLNNIENIIVNNDNESFRMAAIYGLSAMYKNPKFASEEIKNKILNIKKMILESSNFSSSEKNLASSEIN